MRRDKEQRQQALVFKQKNTPCSVSDTPVSDTPVSDTPVSDTPVSDTPPKVLANKECIGEISGYLKKKEKP